MTTLDFVGLRKNLIIRYTLALSLIALLVTLAFTFLIMAIKDSNNSAYLVNISGKQRMLSQTIVLDVYRIKVVREKMTNNSDNNLNTELMVFSHRLERNINEMAAANHQLRTGKFLSHGNHALSPELKELYFGSTQLAKKVDSFLALAQTLNKEVVVGKGFEKISHLSQLSVLLLPELDNAVKIYQKEGEDKLSTLKSIETNVWFLTLIALVIEALFIFQPLVRKLTEYANKHTGYKRELEYQVELRTLKLERANQTLADLASKDALTGLQNRLNLEKSTERILELNKKYSTPFAVLMIDIDWFKSVNDDYGHEAGDFVLKESAQILIESVRQTDLIYRTGGEEFVILFEGTSLEDAKAKAEDVRQTFEKHIFKYHDFEIKRTISIGVYHSDIAQVQNFKQIYKLTDDALYRSKAIGRNRINLCKTSSEEVLDNVLHKKGDFVFIRFDADSFRELDKTRSFKNTDGCIKPCEVSENVFELMGVQASRLLDGEHCIREFLHPDDFDLVQRFAETGLQLSELSQQYSSKTLLWRSSFRILNLVGDAKITSLEVYFEPGKIQGSLGLIKLELFESLSLHSSFGDALLVYNFHAMLENTNDYIYFKDRYHVFTAASKTLVKIANVKDRAELVGKTDYDVFPKEYADQYFKLEKQIFSGEVEVAQEYQPTLDDEGNKGWVDNRKYPIKDQNGEIIGLFGIARVISDQEHESLLEVNSSDSLID
ncbi:diguanylate cyclase [Thiomicrorhabdus sp. Milos-T2]|uniref:diguanylate cyclase n=1 Tax=Thiomicrorhabdus sp. Milos-T2 TaxID=90814 RepID=UPI0004946DDD|nr:diguanylate cyclase [Thiomicrorhabdus sp. Milos-T2]